MTVPYQAELEAVKDALRTYRRAGTGGGYLLIADDGRLVCHQRPNNNAFELTAQTAALKDMRVWQGLTHAEITKIKARWEREGDGTPVRITDKRAVLEDQERRYDALFFEAARAPQQDPHLEPDYV